MHPELFFSRIVTRDATRIHHWDPEKKHEAGKNHVQSGFGFAGNFACELNAIDDDSHLGCC